MNGIWFAAAGVAAIFAGLLNLAQAKGLHRSGSVWLICLTGNIIFTLYAITLVVIIREPQTVLSLLLAVAATAATLLSRTPSSAK